AQQVMVLGIVYLATAVIVDVAYVMTASAVSGRFLSQPALQRRTNQFAAATGVAALLAASAGALTFLRFAGAAYLIVLGIQRWRRVGDLVVPERAPIGRIFAQGFLTQLLNPKVAVFFVAFLPQFLNPSQPIAQQVMVLGIVYLATAVIVDVAYVMTASAVSGRFLSQPALQRRTNQFAAATYIALGVVAAALGEKPASR
ncbi:MAG TPA: LysE family translocator, partial [Candidatus Dormibacteraeota bacterium]